MAGRRGSLFAALWMLAAASWSLRASAGDSHADDASDVTEAQQDQANAAALIDEGVELRLAGDERAALERFERAHALAPTPRAAAQMGLANKSLRRYLRAEEHLAEALDQPDDAWVKANREALEAAKALVAKQLAWIAITANVEGATLVVNGVPRGALPLDRQRVVAGQAVIEVQAEGYEPARRELAVPAEEETSIAITLTERAPAEPAPAEPPPPISAPAPPVPPADDAPVGFTPFIIGTAALGFVGLAVGTGLGVHALSLKNERDEVCPNPTCTTQEGLDLDAEGRAMATGATVAFTVGGLASGAALLLWLLEPDDEVVTASGSGLQVRF